MPRQQRKSAFDASVREKTHEPYTSTLKSVQQENGETVAPLDRETVEQQESETALLRYSETAEQSNSKTVLPSKGETVEQLEKTTFYLTHEQAEKLDDLAHEYKKRTGQRINRNDIIRYLIDQASLDSLKSIKRHTKKA